MANYQTQAYGRRATKRRGAGCAPRLILGALLVAGTLFTYYKSTEKDYNEVTGEMQRVGLSEQEEIAMGLHAAPQMAQQHGGLHPDQELQAFLDQVGNRLVSRSAASQTPYQYDFHLLRDPDTVNAFALPGGQVFITMGLYKHFKKEDELAGVLGHEIAHVVARHSAQQIAKSKLWSGITSAAVTASGAGGYGGNAQLAGLVNKVVNTKYGRDDEHESDILGLKFMHDAGYDMEAMIRVMEVLESTSKGPRAPEFMATHPSPANRVELIRKGIEEIRRMSANR